MNALLLIFYELVHLNKEFVGALTRSLATSSPNLTPPPDDSPVPAKANPAARTTRKSCPIILQEFLKFASIILQEAPINGVAILRTKPESTPQNLITDDPSNVMYLHLCQIIFLCLLEHKIFRRFIFDVNLTLDFHIYKKV